MEKGLGILDQINNVFWKKKTKGEPVKRNDVEIDGACLEGAETSSEYWSQLSVRKRKGSGVSGGGEPQAPQGMGNLESEPKTNILTNGLNHEDDVKINVEPTQNVTDKPKQNLNSSPKSKSIDEATKNPPVIDIDIASALKRDINSSQVNNQIPNIPSDAAKTVESPSVSNAEEKRFGTSKNEASHSIEEGENISPKQMAENIDSKISDYAASDASKNPPLIEKCVAAQIDCDQVSIVFQGNTAEGSKINDSVESISVSTSETKVLTPNADVLAEVLESMTEAKGGKLTDNEHESENNGVTSCESNRKNNQSASTVNGELIKKKGMKAGKVSVPKRQSLTDFSDSTLSFSSSTRRMSEAPKPNRRMSSGATSPEIGSRRDSGAMSPLSFNSIQEKIEALSRDSSIADIPRKRVPKVKKLDETMLAAVKETKKEKPKDIVKVTPKIDSILQTKILKFGVPSAGAKIPVKKAETVSGMSYSAVGGYSIKDGTENRMADIKNDLDSKALLTPKGSKKIKPRAPQPPGSESGSIPSTPSSERKIKKVKGKAPQPPTSSSQPENLTSLSMEVSDLLEETVAFSKEIQNLSDKSNQADAEALASAETQENTTEDTKRVKLNCSMHEIKNEAPVIVIGEKDESLPGKEPMAVTVKLPVDKITDCVETVGRQQKTGDCEGTRLKVLTSKPLANPSVFPSILPIQEEVLQQYDSKSKNDSAGVDHVSEAAKVNHGPTSIKHSLSDENKKVSLTSKNEVEKKENAEAVHPGNNQNDKNRLEVASYVNSWNNKNGEFEENEEFYEDCETPKASRKLVHLHNDGEDMRLLQWSDIMNETRRVQSDLQRISKRLGDSSGSESFHTPSPRPVMFTSRGEVIGGSAEPKERSPEWTPSPDRDLFTPEGSPLSDFSDSSYDHYVASVDFSVRSVSLPLRVFPQMPRPASYHEGWKEGSPVVFDAGISFDLCSRRTPVRQHLRPCPAHSEPKTASNSLSCRIAEFLSRTDHVMEEWRRLGRADPKAMQSLVELPTHRVTGTARSKSAANIMIKGFQYFSRGSSSRSSWRSPSVSRYSEASDRTLADLEELNEMTADLAEERLNAAQAGERLDAETSERIRLEQELAHVINQKSQLEQAAEKMELELHYAKAYDNGISDGEVDFGDSRDDGDVYKRKCSRLKRENDMLRQQLRQQHEDDLEQLVGLKKQLEKRLADANEEIDEQRQVAAEWKRKSQKLQAELNDFRIIVEEQNSRNSMLEKKQRKFDGEIQMLQDELRSEKNAKERFSRDREVAVSNKCTLEQTLASVRLELELKEEEAKRLARDLEDLSLGGTTEQDITILRKAKHDMEKKIKEQDDELDDLAGQVSLLESAKLKLEMSIENIRKEHRKEIAQKDEDVEEIRSNSMKKLKGLEAALEQEHEERSMLLRSKHELERRLKELEEHDRSTRAADEDALVRLRRDLRKTKALLRDAQVMLDRAKEDSPGKAAMRALKNQLEDTELARASAIKAKQKLAAELSETLSLLEDANRMKGEAESRAQATTRQISTLKTQLEENEEELSELMKKYNQHLATEEARNQEASAALADVEAERNSLREQLAEATARLESMAVADPAPDVNQRRLEMAIQDLKSRLELDGAVRKRLEVQISRLKEKMERLNEECNQYRLKEQSATDQVRKLQVSLRECKEELAVHVAREQEALIKRRDLEKRLEAAEMAASAARAEVKLSAQRVLDLQAALTAEINSESEESSDGESG